MKHSHTCSSYYPILLILLDGKHQVLLRQPDIKLLLNRILSKRVLFVIRFDMLQPSIELLGESFLSSVVSEY